MHRWLSPFKTSFAVSLQLHISLLSFVIFFLLVVFVSIHIESPTSCVCWHKCLHCLAPCWFVSMLFITDVSHWISYALLKHTSSSSLDHTLCLATSGRSVHSSQQPGMLCQRLWGAATDHSTTSDIHSENCSLSYMVSLRAPLWHLFLLTARCKMSCLLLLVALVVIGTFTTRPRCGRQAVLRPVYFRFLAVLCIIYGLAVDNYCKNVAYIYILFGYAISTSGTPTRSIIQGCDRKDDRAWDEKLLLLPPSYLTSSGQ